MENKEQWEIKLKNRLKNGTAMEYDEVVDFIRTLLQTTRREAIESVLPEKRNGVSQIQMPNDYNPDRLSDVVFCCQNNITDTFNACRSAIIQTAKEKFGIEIK